MQLLEFEEM